MSDCASPDLISALAAFTEGRRTVPPQRECSAAELERLSASDGLRHFTVAPINGYINVVSEPPTSVETKEAEKYLWVIQPADVPFAPEQCGLGRKCKHTNITGGEQAYCGGELWFQSPDKLYFNGGSGRYPCEHDEELLEASVRLFISLGFSVATPPYDEDIGSRPRIFKSNAQVNWRSE